MSLTSTPESAASTETPAGFGYVLSLPLFRALWVAQILSLTALNSSIAIQLFLIERVTTSSASQVGMLMAFNLPAVLFSTLAGVLVDRVSKKWVMIGSNGIRILTQILLAYFAYQMLQNPAGAGPYLWGVYLVTFFTSATGQFFAPAEGGMIPLIVGKRGLMVSNSLFTITIVALNAGGLLILGPLATKVFGIVPALALGIALYLGATMLVSLLPLDRPARDPARVDAGSVYRRMWNEVREGWGYALKHRGILLALGQISLVGMVVYVLAAIAPGYAARVLGLHPEDAVVVFWPAALGLVVASFLVGRFGARFSRTWLANAGLFVVAAGVLGLGVAPQAPQLELSLRGLVALSALLLGIGLALIQIPTQTVIQEESPPAVRGRVLTVQFTLGNLVALPPLLALGYLADALGIFAVILILAALLLAGACANAWYLRRLRRRAARIY